jgi:hypothetical protein
MELKLHLKSRILFIIMRKLEGKQMKKRIISSICAAIMVASITAPINVQAKDNSQNGEYKLIFETNFNQNDNTKEFDNVIGDDNYPNSIYEYEKLFKCIENGQEFTIKDEKIKKAYDKAKDILSKIIKPEMSEFEKELAINDYIVNNVRYDIDYFYGKIDEDSSTPYGALIKGKGLCGGYAYSTKLLLNLAGVECWIIEGTAKNDYFEGPHGWNIVKIDGKYYHLDTTWQDPVDFSNPERNQPNYGYFNISDSEIEKSHTWNKEDYVACVNSFGTEIREILNTKLQLSKYSTYNNGYFYFRERGLKGNEVNKIKFDGTGLTKLFEGKVDILRADDEWLYYSDPVDEYNYKIRVDGTEKTKLNYNTSYITESGSRQYEIKDEWIYTYKDFDGCLYKVKTDGTGGKYFEGTNPRIFTISGEYVYYTERYKPGIYKIKMDGSKNTKISDKTPASFYVHNEHLYFNNEVWDDQYIYRTDLNGKKQKKIGSKRIREFKVTDEYIYYVDYDKVKLYRMSLNGRDVKKISDDEMYSFEVNGEWIYYYNSEDYQYYKMKLDGSDRQKEDEV